MTMSDQIHKLAFKGELEFGGIKIPCYVTEDGLRVLSGRTMTSAVGMKGRGAGMARIATHKALNPFISDELRSAIENPKQLSGFGSATHGYEATVLLQICEAILTARDNDVLKTEQELRYAKHADILVRAFARVGIIALIDEATGYQDIRAKDELYKILEAYISEELRPWQRRFPNEFYKELFRLQNWPYDPLSVKRPSYVGKLTNRLIYEKLPPGVLDKLKQDNPANEKGHRKYRHHQFLTEEIGNAHLEKQLTVVTTLMKISPNWRKFESNFNRAFPAPHEQIGFDFGDDDDE
jgi:hypothetical protein